MPFKPPDARQPNYRGVYAGPGGRRRGGSVSYSISGAAGLAVSPASGSLAAGASATITVTSASLISLDEQLTVSPGGYAVTVVLNLSL